MGVWMEGVGEVRLWKSTLTGVWFGKSSLVGSRSFRRNWSLDRFQGREKSGSGHAIQKAIEEG